MKKGKDGARDEHGELLPELSSSATKMNYEKLVNTPLPKFNEKYPGSPLFMEIGYFALRRTFSSIFRTLLVLSFVQNSDLIAFQTIQLAPKKC